MDELRLHGLINGSAGLKKFFGDGSDGILDLSDVNPDEYTNTITLDTDAVAMTSTDTLFDGNAATPFTFYGPADGVLFTVAYEKAVSIKSWVFNNIDHARAGYTLSGIKLEISEDGINWFVAGLLNLGVAGTPTTLTISNTTGRGFLVKYWRLREPNSAYTNHSSYAISIGYMTYVSDFNNFDYIVPIEDASSIIRQYQSINIPLGKSLSTNKRTSGILLYSQNNVDIDGSITLDRKGARCPSDLGGIGGITALDELNALYVLKGGAGGDGGDGGTRTDTPNFLGAKGSTGGISGGGCGGGGAGGDAYTQDGGAGSSVNFYQLGGTPTGGAAKSGLGSNNTALDGNAGVDGGGGSGAIRASASVGGTSTSGSGGSGVGGGGGGGNTDDSIASGSGGYGNGYGGAALFLVCGGTVKLTGSIYARGGNGGVGGNGRGGSSSFYCGSGGGGGGGGGGIVAILYKSALTNTGIINVDGGTAGAAGAVGTYCKSGYPGTSGGIGTIKIKKV